MVNYASWSKVELVVDVFSVQVESRVFDVLVSHAGQLLYPHHGLLGQTHQWLVLIALSSC